MTRAVARKTSGPREATYLQAHPPARSRGLDRFFDHMLGAELVPDGVIWRAPEPATKSAQRPSRRVLFKLRACHLRALSLLEKSRLHGSALLVTHEHGVTRLAITLEALKLIQRGTFLASVGEPLTLYQITEAGMRAARTGRTWIEVVS